MKLWRTFLIQQVCNKYMEAANWFSVSKKLRQTKFAGQITMIIFFHHNGIMYQYVVPPKTTMNGEYYVSVLEILRWLISRKYHELVRNWTLHHNNARPYVATFIQRYLSKWNIKLISHFSDGIDLVPTFFGCKGKRSGRKINTVLKLFHYCRAFWNTFQKKTSLLSFKRVIPRKCKPQRQKIKFM